MNKNFKKLCAGVLAISALGTVALANGNTWQKVGYDTSDAAVALGRYACVYQEYDAYGIPTGNVKSGDEIYALNMDLPAFAKTVTWNNAFLDRSHYCSISQTGDFLFANHDLIGDHDCGNLEYANLVLDGQKQERIVATSAYGDVEYRWTNLFWEKAAPYKIYQKKEANFGDGWYTDATYPMRYSGENEEVVVTQPQVFVDTTALPAVLNATGMEDLFNKGVEKVYQRYLTGTSMPVTVIDDVTYPDGLFTDGLLAEPKWVDAGYEEVAPYRMYQILELDGYAMDGSMMTIQTNGAPIVFQKPYIFRYTGGYAKPTITYTNYVANLDLYDAEQRIAPVYATIVLDGKVTSLPPVATGEWATFDYEEVYDVVTATKWIDGTLTARVNDNGNVVVMTGNFDALPVEGVNWGSVALYEVESYVNDWVYNR